MEHINISKANKAKCVYCGNNPVPHFANWYFESLNVLFTPIRQWVLKNRLSVVFRNFFIKINFTLKLVGLLKMFRAISFQTDIEKCRVPRAKVLWKEAMRRNIEMFELLFFGKPIDVYIARKKKFQISNFKFLNKFQNSNPKFQTIIF